VSYTIRIVPSAVKALASLPASVRKRIGRKIDSLAGEPFPPGAVKLVGAKGDFYRVRIGDYRIVYQTKKNVLLVLVVKIGHRRDVYLQL
jgi:mRNA interferase RelE/StbE